MAADYFLVLPLDGLATLLFFLIVVKIRALKIKDQVAITLLSPSRPLTHYRTLAPPGYLPLLHADLAAAFGSTGWRD